MENIRKYKYGNQAAKVESASGVSGDLCRIKMRTIDIDKIGKELIDFINKKDPIDEDIGVIDHNGDLVGVLVSPQAYELFIEKVEEEEDRLDRETVAEFHKSREK